MNSLHPIFAAITDRFRDVAVSEIGLTDSYFDCVIDGLIDGETDYFFPVSSSLTEVMRALAANRNTLPAAVRQAFDAAVWDATKRCL